MINNIVTTVVVIVLISITQYDDKRIQCALMTQNGKNRFFFFFQINSVCNQLPSLCSVGLIYQYLNKICLRNLNIV